MTIKFFMRKKYPAYFSIEQIFSALCLSIKKQPFISNCEILEVPYFLSAINFFRNIFFVRSNQSAINHITGDIHYAILGCNNKNLNVLTIHDCVLLEKYSKWDIRYWIFRTFWYDLPMRKADLVTVISEKTKAELLTKLGYGENKIRVVNNFVNEIFQPVPRVFNKKKPEILFIGSTDNKNLDRILQAIKGIECRLNIVGRISTAQESFIRDNNIAVDISYALSIEEVFAKYAESDIVMFPSLYEGFGMLIIEANAVGRPVITSNISPLKEVAGNAAILVDPYEVSSIREAVRKVISDDDYRNQLVNEGYINAKRFSIDTVTGNYLNLYKEFKK